MTSRFDNKLATDTLKVKRITVDSEVLIAVEPPDYSSIGFTLNQVTVEGTTTSPTDYDSLSSSDYTGSEFNNESYYYSTFSYSTGTATNSDSTTYKYLALYPIQLGIYVL